MLLHSDDSSRSFFSAVQRRLSRQAFETWFQPLCVTRSATDVLRIAVPNPAVRDWILSQYSSVLKESLSELQMDACRIEWAIPKGDSGTPVNSLVELTQEAEKGLVGCLTING